MIPPHIEERIRREIIYTALKNGSINDKPVFGAIMKDHASELKPIMSELRECIAAIAEEYRSLDAQAIGVAARDLGVEYVEKDTSKDMVELEVDGAFRVRIPPEPSKHLHVGHALSFLINDIYAKRYSGDVVLRFEDTNPGLARQEFVDSIREDIELLGIEPAIVSFASDHMDDYSSAIMRLIESGDAYVCFCDRESMSKLRRDGVACACRDKPSSEHLLEFENMRSGVYEPGDAVIRLAGDMEHKNAAMRDPVLARIITTPHYRLGDTHRVWPLYDLENVVMDGLEKITHVLRDNSFGEMRAELQGELRSRLKLPKIRVYQYGRFRIEGKETSGRAIREGIESGAFDGWDDPRLATLKAMRRRGFVAQTYRDIAREVGLSPTQTRVDEKMLAKYNRRHVDAQARRYSFVYDPVSIEVEGYEPRTVRLRSHPEREERDREFTATGVFLIRSDDAKLDSFRLMDAGNIVRDGSSYRLDSESLEDFRSSGGSAIINWLAQDHIEAEVIMPDGSLTRGRVESSIAHEKVGSIIQLERFGFGRVEHHADGLVRIVYAHS